MIGNISKVFLIVWIPIWIFLFSMSVFARMTPLEVMATHVIAVEGRVEIQFNQPVIPFFAKKGITISPGVSVDYEFSDSMRRVVLSSSEFSEGMVYDIKIKGVRAVTFAQMNKEQKFGFFYELNPLPLAEVSLAKLPEIGIGRAFKASIGEWVQLSKPKKKEGKYIDIDIKNQLLTLYEDGNARSAFEISSGKYGMPTPLGEFKVLNKEENHWSSIYGLWMPYSLRFYGGYFIHELPYWPGGYREGVDHLGHRVSAGCVRLGIGAAEEVYAFADMGTVVVVH